MSNIADRISSCRKACGLRDEETHTHIPQICRKTTLSTAEGELRKPKDPVSFYEMIFFKSLKSFLP